MEKGVNSSCGDVMAVKFIKKAVDNLVLNFFKITLPTDKLTEMKAV